MPVKMKINDSLQRKLDEARIRMALKDATTETMIKLRDRCVIEAPGPGRSKTPNPTGNLRRSHSYEVLVSSTHIEGLVKNSADYWQYVNFGTSRQDANNFVERAIEKVQPNQMIADLFHEKYKS